MAIRLLIAPDSFKQCRSASEICSILAQGAREAAQGRGVDLSIVRQPMSDGGEGFLAALEPRLGARWMTASCTHSDRETPGPPIAARWLYHEEERTAYGETAEVVGLGFSNRRSPAGRTASGVGQYLLAMLRQGARRIVLGVGGTGTVDGGASVLDGLGSRFYRGDEVIPVHGAMDASRADRLELPQGWKDVELECWCDVDTPLIGPRGAALTFAAQKGADDQEVRTLVRELELWAAWLQVRGGVDPYLPGTGAGGGIPFGLAVMPRSVRKRGGPAIAERLGLAEQIERADVIWTGEGRIDASTAAGKLVGTILELARPLAKPVVAFAGQLEGELDRILKGCDVVVLNPPGEDACQGILEVEERLRQAARLVLTRYLDGQDRGRPLDRLDGAS